MMLSADRIIKRLNLAPHPEGGHYREVYRHAGENGARGAVTAIYFLLKQGEASKWHRVDADEIWHHYDGAPLFLSIYEEGGETRACTLGKDIMSGELPVLVVRAGAWQSAKTLGAWTLVGCTVSPAFQFDGFELAEEGWAPPR